MKFVWWMLGGSVVSAVAITLLVGSKLATDVWLGMIGPLTAAIGTWIAVERAHKRDPQRLSKVVLTAFAAKMVFFGGYVTTVVGGGFVHPIPFVISFISYFLALHCAVAIGLYRLSVEDISGRNPRYR